MKKLFTLMAFVLIAGSAFGQKKWTNTVTNSDVEEAQSADWSSFWVHEWRGDMSERTDGFAEIVADPVDPSNHVAKVAIRSREEAYAAGNYTKDYTGAEGTYASWDTQFFIYATEPIPAGKELRLTMRVKGEKAGTFETQCHSFPGTYIDANMFGNISYTTEWQTIQTQVVTVASSQAEGGFQSVAFNLSTTDDSNVLYFDDIKLEIKDPKVNDPNADWINFMRRGVYSHDHITGLDANGDPWECTNYTVQTPAGVVPAELESIDGQMVVKVPVRGYYISQVEDLDEEGNQQVDDDGNVKMKNMYYWSDGEEIGTSAPARWTCQFFVSTLHKMETGERYRFRFQVKADAESALGTQAHYGPTQYKDYNTFGSESDFPVGTDWTTYDLGESQGKTVPAGANGCQTITFDCVPLENTPNNFYFIFEECSFTEDRVKIEDRTLGTPEDIVLLVSAEDEEMANTIDISPMLAAFELNDLSFLTTPKKGDGMKLFALVYDDDLEEDVEGFSSMLNWADGGFIDANGYFIPDSDNGINIRFDDESMDASNVNINVWNNPESGISFADGKEIQTKICVSNDGWYYIYNATLKDATTGIKDAKIASQNDGVIYDLTGRQIAKPAKGLYIQNGKKYIQK